ncbi:hypothetical protein [Marinobacterium aestuariivivens]|uniref:MacB-like periplasmic core domain-containing protein n=1 Tax=Marinobacterium aestuariivivens TaxID=1698799 RepID=A0ABW2A2V4_9GAMM
MGLGYVFLSHYRRHPGQLAGLLLILICAAMLWSGVQSLTDRAARSASGARTALEPLLSLIRLDGRAVTAEDFARLRLAGFCITPRLEVRFPGTDRPLLVGIDPFSAACLRQPQRQAPVVATLIDGLDLPLLLGSPGTWRAGASRRRRAITDCRRSRACRPAGCWPISPSWRTCRNRVMPGCRCCCRPPPWTTGACPQAMTSRSKTMALSRNRWSTPSCSVSMHWHCWRCWWRRCWCAASTVSRWSSVGRAS